MTSMPSSPDFRLPQNMTPHIMFSAQLSTGSIYSGSVTDSSRRASTRIPEVSLFGIFWGTRATCHHGRLDIIPSTLLQQDFRRSARSFLHTGSHPSLVSTLFQQKCGFSWRSADPHLHLLRRLLTNSRGRASSGCFEELLREVLPINVGQSNSVT